MYSKFIIALFIVLIILTGCTSNSMTKKFGGTQTVMLDKGKKLVNITWKDNSMWIITKPMTANDIAETYEFGEKSNYGIIEGTVIIKEVK